MIERRVIFGGTKVRPGATWQMSLQALQFQGRVRCESAHPASYVAELLFANEVLITTEGHLAQDEAEKALRQIVAERVRALLAK